MGRPPGPAAPGGGARSSLRTRRELLPGLPARALAAPLAAPPERLQIGVRLGEIPTDPDQPVLLICNTQNRSRATLQALRERG